MTTNPFEKWQFHQVRPADEPTPIPLLVQSTILGTVDDNGIPDHLEVLVDILEQRGSEAWREAALVLLEFLHSGGHYGSGPQAAQQYMETQVPDQCPPELEEMHQLMTAWIHGGKRAASTSFDLAQKQAVNGAVRYLMCLSAGASGLPREQLDGLLGQIVGRTA